MQSKEGLLPAAEVLSGLDGPEESDPRSLVPGVAPLHPSRSGEGAKTEI